MKNTSNSELDGTNLLSIRSEFLESGKAKAMVMSALDHPMISSELSKALGGLQVSKGYKELMASLALSLAYTKVPGEFSIRMNKFAVKEDSNFETNLKVDFPKEWVEANKGEFKISLSDKIAAALGFSTKAKSFVNTVRLLFNHDCDKTASSKFGDRNVCVPSSSTEIAVRLKNSND